MIFRSSGLRIKISEFFANVICTCSSVSPSQISLPPRSERRPQRTFGAIFPRVYKEQNFWTLSPLSVQNEMISNIGFSLAFRFFSKLYASHWLLLPGVGLYACVIIDMANFYKSRDNTDLSLWRHLFRVCCQAARSQRWATNTKSVTSSWQVGVITSLVQIPHCKSFLQTPGASFLGQKFMLSENYQKREYHYRVFAHQHIGLRFWLFLFPVPAQEAVMSQKFQGKRSMNSMC